MDAPDKLHCMHRLNGDYSCSTTPFGGSVEYIRKDALLEWAEDVKRGFIMELEKYGVQNEQRIFAFQELIDKLNSL